MKHQTVDNAFGFTVDINGPTSLRQNDLALLCESNINNRFSTLQLGELIQYIRFGDSAYKLRSHITGYAKAPPGEALQTILFVSWNKACKKVRISIEWNNNRKNNLFLCYHKCRELGLQPIFKHKNYDTFISHYYTKQFMHASTKYVVTAYTTSALRVNRKV